MVSQESRKDILPSFAVIVASVNMNELTWHANFTTFDLPWTIVSIRYPLCLATRVEALAGLNSLNGNQDGGDHKHGEVPRSLQSTWRMSLLCTMCLGHNDCMDLRATTWWKDMKWLEILTYFNKFNKILTKPTCGIWLYLTIFACCPTYLFSAEFQVHDGANASWRISTLVFPPLGESGSDGPWAVIFIHFLYEMTTVTEIWWLTVGKIRQ